MKLDVRSSSSSSLRGSRHFPQMPEDSFSTDKAHSSANPNLSVVEIEQLLRSKVSDKIENLQILFQSYDVNQILSVTRGEFRRVLESTCFPMTTDQFDSVMVKVPTNENGTVRYVEFLEKFGGRVPSRAMFETAAGRQSFSPHGRPGPPGSGRVSQSSDGKDMNIDMIESTLRAKISRSLKQVTKAMRLFDYNRDGNIQKHELRRVLDNYCFRLTDSQFDRLFARYDFHHTNVINYKDFLLRLGVSSASARSRSKSDGFVVIPRKEDDKPAGPRFVVKNQPIQPLDMLQVEREFREKMLDNHDLVCRAFMSLDLHRDGFVSVDDLKSVLNNFVMFLPDPIFVQLMDRCHFKANGRVPWRKFLDKFGHPISQTAQSGNAMPMKAAHKVNPVRGLDQSTTTSSVMRLLRDHVQNNYASARDAFLHINRTHKGDVSRRELRAIMEKQLKLNITDDQYKELMIVLDPDHTNMIPYHTFVDLFEERESKAAKKAQNRGEWRKYAISVTRGRNST